MTLRHGATPPRESLNSPTSYFYGFAKRVQILESRVFFERHRLVEESQSVLGTLKAISYLVFLGHARGACGVTLPYLDRRF